MKKTLWITLGAIISSSLIVSAEDKPKRPEGKDANRAAVMEKFDTDKDGKLSEDERKAMQEARRAKVDEFRKEMITKYDKDGDGELNEEERTTARTARQAELIKKFDTDGDGKLNAEERAKMPKPERRPGGPGGKRGPDGGKRGRDGAGPADAPETKAPAVE